jgi:hypothetical protein
LAGVGLAFGVIGSIVLAVSLNTLTGEQVLCLRFVDTTVGALCSTSNVPRFTGIEERLAGGVTSAKRRTVIGVSLVTLAFVFQFVALLVQVCTSA